MTKVNYSSRFWFEDFLGHSFGLKFGKKKKIFRKFFKRREIVKLSVSVFDRMAKLDWRLGWYAVSLWLLASFVGGVVILPWFYLAFALCLFILTAMFFRKVKLSKRNWRKNGDTILAKGLWLGLFWSVVVLFLDIVEFVGFDFTSLIIYASDSRNWFKFPIIIMMPIVYSLILQNLAKREYLKKSETGKVTRAGTLA